MKRRFTIRQLAAVAVTSLAASTALGQSGTWDTTDSGNWSDTANWLGGIVAGGAGNTATFPTISTGSTTVTLDSAVTIGALDLAWDDSVSISRAYEFAGTNPLIFDNNGSGASIVIGEWFRGVPSFSVPVILADDLVFDVTQQNNLNFTSTTTTFADLDVGTHDFSLITGVRGRGVQVDGVLSGTGSLTVDAQGTTNTTLTLANPNNTFSGQINLNTATGPAIRAFLSIAGSPDALGDTSQINFNNGQLQVTFSDDWTLPLATTLNFESGLGGLPTGLTVEGDNQMVGAGQVRTVGGGARSLRVEGSNPNLLGGVFMEFGSVEALHADSFGDGPIAISPTANFGRNAYRALHAVDQDLVDRFTSNSRGILALGLDTSTDLDLSGSPDLQLGSAIAGGLDDPGVVYSGSLTPGASGYLLGGVGKITFDTDIAGAHNIRVGKDAVGGLTVLAAANSFTGTLTVESAGVLHLAHADAAQSASAVITSGTQAANLGAIGSLLLDPSVSYSGAAMAAIQLDGGAIGWTDDVVLTGLPGIYTSRLINVGGNKRVLHLGGAESRGTMTQDSSWDIADDGATAVHLVKSGLDSVLDLTGVAANSFSGGLTILQGKVLFSDVDQLGSAASNRVDIRQTGVLALAEGSGDLTIGGGLLTVTAQGGLFGNDLSSSTIQVDGDDSLTITGLNAFANTARNRLVKVGDGTLTLKTDALITNQLSAVLTVAEGTLEMNQQPYRNNSILTGHLAVVAEENESATYRLLAPPSDPTVLANYEANYGFQGIRFVGAGTNIVDVDAGAILRVHAGGAMANSQISWGAGTAVKTGLGVLEFAKGHGNVSIDVAPGAVFVIDEGVVVRSVAGAEIFTDNFTGNLGMRASVVVDSAGTLEVGLGDLSVEVYTQTGTLHTTWAGTGAGEVGTLVTQSAVLGGTLDLDVTYAPAVGATPGDFGDVVTILTSATPITGTFSTVQGRVLDPVAGQFASVIYNTNSVEIGAFQALPGDATGSRSVDIDDASILLGNFGQTSGMTWLDADFTGDGAVDIDDASLLLGNFGASYSPAAGEIEVTIDIANKQVLIEANQVALIRLEDPSGNIISYDPAVAFSTVNPVTPTLVGEFMLGNFITGTAVIGFADFVNQEVIIGYQLLGQDRIDNTYVLIPEPASLALLSLGGLAILRRRSR
ncbi:MAG: PEP-CTERM sorting domain-containing protein [Phycisphaeraceae bacterium]|nr:PEP-CTERM sorting domain-containing protein [Phycisphaeraceae bacterium]